MKIMNSSITLTHRIILTRPRTNRSLLQVKLYSSSSATIGLKSNASQIFLTETRVYTVLLNRSICLYKASSSLLYLSRSPIFLQQHLLHRSSAYYHSPAAASVSSSSTFSTFGSWIRKHPKMSIGSLITFLITGATASLIYYAHDQVGGTEGLYRTLSFYSLAIPKYIEYRYHQYMDSPNEIWDTLHDETSKQGLEKILQLKGFYIKTGQMCAANFGNAFPPIWQRNMAILQDQCPHEDFTTVQSILKDEFHGIPLESIFSYIDPIPIGAASIGQVHRARLTKEGKDVVIKIMYPNVEGVFRGDVRTIKMFAQLAQPVHVPPLEEVEKQFMTEFDYKREAEQLHQVRKNLIHAGLADDTICHDDETLLWKRPPRGEHALCRIPKPYLEYCTKRVLVMEELKGIKLVDGLRQDLERHASRAGMSVDEFKTRQEDNKRRQENLMVENSNRSVESSRSIDVVSEEIVGPSTTEYDQFIRLLDAQRRINNIGRRLYNYTLGLIPGVSKKQIEGRNILPLNHAKLIDDLIYVHGHEVLVDGMFNGDPHPGNILLLGMDDGKPHHLGLIDYGQVKRISTEDRLLLCKIIIALADEDKPEIVRLVKKAGYKSKYMDDDLIYKYAKVSFDETSRELTDGKHIQVFMEDLQARDPIETLPNEFIMVGRTSIMLRGIAHALHQPRSVAKAWKPLAIKVLSEEDENR